MSSIRDALAAGSFYVALQPVVDLNKREIFGHEALLRSRVPEFPDPPTILKAAIREGCLGELARALRQMAVDAVSGTHLFLNMHPKEFDEGFLVRPDDAMFQHDRSIYLEITEAVPLSHFRHCHGVLAEVRSRGVMLAVDDLGAGYSNLKYIADLSPEIVKLDRELITGLEKQPRLRKLVKSIVHLCEDMGARVVAEGIETHGELRAAVDCGAHFFQGYLLARPAFPPPAVDFATLEASEEFYRPDVTSTDQFSRDVVRKR